jgi:hypothetical protein
MVSIKTARNRLADLVRPCEQTGIIKMGSKRQSIAFQRGNNDSNAPSFAETERGNGERSKPGHALIGHRNV